MATTHKLLPCKYYILVVMFGSKQFTPETDSISEMFIELTGAFVWLAGAFVWLIEAFVWLAGAVVWLAGRLCGWSIHLLILLFVCICPQCRAGTYYASYL